MQQTEFNYVLTLTSGKDHNDISMFNPEVHYLFRDRVFKDILDSFNGRAIRVFQVGAIESLKDGFRLGSGWSDIFWGSYIRKHGGELFIVDLDLDHICNSSFMGQQLKYPVHLQFGDGTQMIDKGFDIYYLDGADISYADDAYYQTLNQFKKIEGTNSIVLVDDVPTKAQKLKEYVDAKADTENWIVKEYSCGNGMMTIDMRK